MEITKTLLTLGFLLPLISAQLSFFDSRFPPSPATRRIIVRNNQFIGGRSAALLQAPESDELVDNSPVSQEHEDSSQEIQEPDLDNVQEPIIQEPVPTQRPLRNGLGQSQPLPSRSANGFSRVPQQTQQKQQQFNGVGGEEGTDEEVSQKADTALTDISMEDVSTEGITPGVTLSSSEEDTTTEDDFGGPTEAIPRAQVTTVGPIAAQRRGSNGNGGRKPSANGFGRKSLVINGQKPVAGNGRRTPSRPLPKPTKPVAQEVDSGEEEVTEVQKPTAPVRRPTGPTRDRQPVTQVDIDDSEEQTPEAPKPVAPVRRPPGSGGRRPVPKPAPKPVTQSLDSDDDQQISDGQTEESPKPVAPVRRPPGGRGRPAPVPSDVDSSSDGQAVDGGDGSVLIGGEGHDSGSDDQSGHEEHHSGDPIQWLRDAVRGEPGSDYPIFYEPPETSFKCSDQQYPGYYADVEARCQVFHICQENGRSDAFLCPNGTVFSQQHFVCIWWHDFDCSTATQFYELNSQLYITSESQGPGEAPEGALEGTPEGSAPTKPITGPTGGRPSTRPLPPAPVDAIGRGGPEGQPDERIQSGGDSTEGQEPDTPQDIGTELPSVPFQSSPDFPDTSDESTEAPGDEVITSGPKRGGAAPNGRPKAGIKGGAKAVAKNGNGGAVRRNGSTNGKGRNGVTKKNGQPTAPQRNGSNGSAPKPATNGLKKNGIAKKTNGANGQTSIPSSPADNARNGIQKSRTNGAGNGGQQKQRTTSGTKSSAGYRTAQRQERDGQTSNWYYFTGL